MLPISKLPEPPGLRAYKNAIHAAASYDNFRSYNGYTITIKGEIRNAFYELRIQLLREQKFVCAYCGQIVHSVVNENGVAQMKTEHFNPQDQTVANDLDYQNLLACCLGEQGSKGDGHCDSKKGNDILNHISNPSLLTVRDRTISYRVKTKSEEVLILSCDKDKDSELNKILNLNHQRLKSRRFSIWKNHVLKHLGEERTWTEARVREIKTSYNQIMDGQNKEFKDFILWYLDEWLQKRGS